MDEVRIYGSGLSRLAEPEEEDHGGKAIGLFLTLNDMDQWEKAMKDLDQLEQAPGSMIELIVRQDRKGRMECYLDGDHLCIVRPDFVDLQESDAMFIPMTDEQMAEFCKLQGDE